MDGPYRSLVVGWKAEVGLECAHRTYGKSDQNPSITKRWCHIWESLALSTVRPIKPISQIGIKRPQKNKYFCLILKKVNIQSIFHYAFYISICEMLAQSFCPLSVGLSNLQMFQIIKISLFYHLNKYFWFVIIFPGYPWKNKLKQTNKQKTQHMKCHQDRRNLFTTVSQETFEFFRSLFPLVSIALSLFLPPPQSLFVSWCTHIL